MSGRGPFPEGGVDGENVQQPVAHKRMQEQKAQVAEVTGILKKNVDLILQRDEKLTDLDDRADALHDEASEFGQQAGKLQRKYWWQNCKMLAILIGIGFVFIVIILASPRTIPIDTGVSMLDGDNIEYPIQLVRSDFEPQVPVSLAPVLSNSKLAGE